MNEMENLNLSCAELYELTHYKNAKKQIWALRFMGIEHRVRPDGSVAVLRAHVKLVMGALPHSQVASKPSKEPNWSNVNVKTA